MVCPSREQKKERSIKERSVVSLRISARVDKHTGVALLLTEQVTACFIPCLEELSDMTVFSSLSILHLILLWKDKNVEELWLTTWQMVPSIE